MVAIALMGGLSLVNVALLIHLRGALETLENTMSALASAQAATLASMEAALADPPTAPACAAPPTTPFEPLLPPGACRARVQFDNVMLRSLPNSAAATLRELCAGQVVGVIGQDVDENWYEVHTGRDIGWVLDTLIQIDDLRCPVPIKTPALR